ncbi:MAG: TetR/AcrR family transcriptional regulator [Hyphomonadaceae bacterium]|nr:TetR/AcrR family transcriptional regulator [Hyphomonadaceae bacterium]
MLGQREEQKQRTRARILAAARKLFADPGYDATTIRMIALEAGVATGSVFTTFESKEDVLFAITGEVFEDISVRLAERFRAADGSTRDRLKLFFAEAFAAMHERMALMMVHFGLSWRWDMDFEATRHNHIGKIFGIALELLKEGVRNGEIHRDADLAVLADVLVDIYVRNFRRAWYRRMTPEAVAALSARQLDLIFDGARGSAATG